MFYTVVRRNIIALLISLYFFIYTVSPLSFTLTEEAIAGTSPASDSYSSVEQDVHILLLDFLCSEFIAHEKAEEDTPQFKILLRKKRAIISKNIIPKLLSLKSIASVDFSFVSAHNSFTALPTHGIPHQQLIESYHRCADLSPPRFSQCLNS